jgi:hypothetical protein
VGFQTYLSTRVVIRRYNQKGPAIREKLLCCVYCIHFPQYLPEDYWQIKWYGNKTHPLASCVHCNGLNFHKSGVFLLFIYSLQYIPWILTRSKKPYGYTISQYYVCACLWKAYTRVLISPSPTNFLMYFVWWWEYFVIFCFMLVLLFIYIYIYTHTHTHTHKYY